MLQPEYDNDGGLNQLCFSLQDEEAWQRQRRVGGHHAHERYLDEDQNWLHIQAIKGDQVGQFVVPCLRDEQWRRCLGQENYS